MDELTLDRTYKRGDKDGMVKPIQEWLCLQGIVIKPDADFGSVTSHAVELFQSRAGVPQTGQVDQPTYTLLTQPMRSALAPVPAQGRAPGDLVVAVAEQHLKQHPREVGREYGFENCGPWVRLYMDGNDGQDWPWCAGFACFVLQQACDSLGVPLPVPKSFSSSELAAEAKTCKRFIQCTSPSADRAAIAPGYLFLLRGGATGWHHTGIVVEPEAGQIMTIEGNTNDEGSPEGYEVCLRTRDYGTADYIRV